MGMTQKEQKDQIVVISCKIFVAYTRHRFHKLVRGFRFWSGVCTWRSTSVLQWTALAP